MFPGLTSWAKFRRPCGTELGTVVLTQTLKPSSPLLKQGIPTASRPKCGYSDGQNSLAAPDYYLQIPFKDGPERVTPF